MTGLEPATPCSQSTCAPNCATSRYVVREGFEPPNSSKRTVLQTIAINHSDQRTILFSKNTSLWEWWDSKIHFLLLFIIKLLFMKSKFSEKEFKNASANDKLPCECYICSSIFYKMKKEINSFLNGNPKNSIKFCSKTCEGISKSKKQKVNCDNCNSEFYKREKEINKTKHNFCSKSCAATYRNTHKTQGTRRSKLEVYLEEQLTSLYPNLQLHFNKKDTINSELDIYIPSLKLAFELNGIFHYEPIYGPEKLAQIQNNDQRKFQACLEKNIELVLIDSSTMKKFKKHKADKFLNILVEIINNKSKNILNS